MRIILTVLGSLLLGTLFCQVKVHTSIQENTKTYPGKDFAITRVIDARVDRDNLGTVRKTDLHDEYVADFWVPLPVEFFKFFKQVFPSPKSPAQIVMVVNVFEIGHKVTGKKNDTGFVKADFDYYTMQNDTGYFLYNYKNTLVDVNDNIALTHSNRMKRILLMSVAKMDSLSLKDKTTQLLPGFIKDISYSYSETKKHSEDSTHRSNDYPAEKMGIIMGHALFGSVANMYGGSFSILGRLKNHQRTLIGFNANYFIIAFRPDVTVSPNTAYKMFTTDFGIKLLRQIKHAVFFNSNAHLMLGRETFTTTKAQVIGVSNGYAQDAYHQEETTHFLTGLQFDNGLFFTPPQNKGVAAGIDLILRFTNSSVFDSDFGVKFSLGISF